MPKENPVEEPSVSVSAAEQASDWKTELLSFVKTIVFLIVIVIIFRASILEPYKIPSGSMIPTLRIGDQILVSKLSFGIRLPFIDDIIWRYSSPKRGDIVVFTRPDDPTTSVNESKDNIIKRVIGLPGDTIEVRRRTVYINGKALEEDYARWDHGGPPSGNFGPEKIPADHVIVLGDNRDQSKDSRFWNNPFLPMERLKGRALFVYWSWDDLSRIGHWIQ